MTCNFWDDFSSGHLRVDHLWSCCLQKDFWGRQVLIGLIHPLGRTVLDWRPHILGRRGWRRNPQVSWAAIKVYWVASILCLLPLCAYDGVHILADHLHKRMLLGLWTLLWCGCCSRIGGSCDNRCLKLKALPLWFLLCWALPHSPPEEKTRLLRGCASTQLLGDNKRQASEFVTWCTMRWEQGAGQPSQAANAKTLALYVDCSCKLLRKTSWVSTLGWFEGSDTDSRGQAPTEGISDLCDAN